MSNGPWTISKLHQWEGCGLQYALEHQPAKVIGRFRGWTLAKLPERSEGPALKRGSEIHDGIDRFLRGASDDLPKEVREWTSRIDNLGANIHEVSVDGGTEVMWQFDDEWYPTEDRAAVWHRQKLDAWFVIEQSDTTLHATVVDFKTGKFYPKNLEQMEVYALGTFAKFDSVDVVETELWYLDKPDDTEEIVSKTYIRSRDSGRLAKRWNGRAQRFIEDEKFRASPGIACRWCAFHRKKGGPCAEGI